MLLHPESPTHAPAHRARTIRLRLALPLLIVSALLAAGPAFARAQAGEGGHRGKGAHDQSRFLEKNAERLGLDAEAQAAIQQVIDASKARSEELRKQERSLHDRMRGLLEQDLPDEVAVMALADEIGAAETATRKHRLGSMLKIRGLLTPEQRAQLSKMHDERREQRKGKMMAHLKQSCGAELESFCAGSQPGRETMMCLRDHEAELSDTCREGLSNHRGRKGKGGKGGKGNKGEPPDEGAEQQ